MNKNYELAFPRILHFSNIYFLTYKKIITYLKSEH